MPRSAQYLHSGCSSSWCLRIRAQRAVEYHLSHFVGWPRTPMAEPIIPPGRCRTNLIRRMRGYETGGRIGLWSHCFLASACSARLVTGGLAVPRRLSNAALAQFVFLHLTALGGRQLTHEFEISRDREIG